MTSSIEKAIERLEKQSGSSLGGSTSPASDVRIDVRDADKRIALDETVHRINLAAFKRQGYLTPGVQSGPLAEQFRMLKLPVLRNVLGQVAAPVPFANLIMITSALPGEGKTFTSINLAMSMASELDTTVLLVDGDVVKASATEFLGLKDRPGLVDVLADQTVGLSDVIVTTDLPNFRVLPAGRARPNSTELLASERMRRLLEDLSERYKDRIVLFDAPPLLASSQANVLMEHMGQILVVVEAGKTPQRTVQEAVSRLSPDKVIGLVLNKNVWAGKNEVYGEYYGG